MSPLNRVVQHGVIGRLLLSLDGQERIVANLGGSVSRAVGILQRHEAVLPRRLFQLLVLGALDDVIYPPLAQQVGLHLLCRPGLAICRALIHPVDTIRSLFTSRSLELPLEVLLCALFLDFIDALLRAFALCESLLLLFVDGSLIALQSRMERLFEVEVSATHRYGRPWASGWQG